MSPENILDEVRQSQLLVSDSPRVIDEGIPLRTGSGDETETAQGTKKASELGETSHTNEMVYNSSVTDRAETIPVSDNVNYLSLIFRDGLDMPIPGMEFFVTLPSGQMCTATSTPQGAITVPVPAGEVGDAKVEVKGATGKPKVICSVDLAQCKDAVIIRSPKVKADVALRPHQQLLPSPAPKKSNEAKTETQKSAKFAEASKTAQPEKANAAATLVQPTKAAAGRASKSVVVPAGLPPTNVSATGPWWSANGAVERAWKWLSSGLHAGE